MCMIGFIVLEVKRCLSTLIQTGDLCPKLQKRANAVKPGST